MTLSPRKRRVADDDVGGGPFGFAAVRVEQRVAVLDAVERLEDGVEGVRVAVAAAPLDVADPDGDARQLGGEFVDFQPEDVVRAGMHDQFGAEAEFVGVDVGAFLDVAQGFEGEVEEVAAAAGGVEDAEVLEAEQEALVGGAGAFLPCFARRISGVLDRGFGRPHSAAKRFADERVDQFGDGAGVGVVGAERGAGGGVEAAFEQGAEDGGVDGAPVHVGGGAVQGGEVGGGERRNGRCS
jgi:hypothetical protein